MKLIRFPRLSLSFPLLLLGLVALPLLLEESSSAASGDLSTVSASVEELPGESGQSERGQEQDRDPGAPLEPHSTGSCGEGLQAAALQAEPVANLFRDGDSCGSLWRGSGALHLLELETGFSPCISSDSSCLPQGAEGSLHPVRGPPAA